MPGFDKGFAWLCWGHGRVGSRAEGRRLTHLSNSLHARRSYLLRVQPTPPMQSLVSPPRPVLHPGFCGVNSGTGHSTCGAPDPAPDPASPGYSIRAYRPIARCPTQPDSTQRDKWLHGGLCHLDRNCILLTDLHRGGGDRTEARRSFSPPLPTYYWRDRCELGIVSNGERVVGMLYPRESVGIEGVCNSPSMRG
jgi:hypothetical protein